MFFLKVVLILNHTLTIIITKINIEAINNFSKLCNCKYSEMDLFKKI